MNQDNKRQSKSTGINNQRVNAMKRLKEVRNNGGKRLDQAIEEEINAHGGIDQNLDDDYDDNDFVVDDEGRACNYGDDDEEDEEDINLERKKPKMEANNIMNYISKMAVSANTKVTKQKPTLKPKENTDKFMKNLLSELDADEDMPPVKSGITAATGYNNTTGYNFNNLSSSSVKNNAKIRTFGLNPNFLPEFEKKLTTNSADKTYVDDNIQMEGPSSHILIGREMVSSPDVNLKYSNQSAKRTREELNKSNNNNNNKNNNLVSNSKANPELCNGITVTDNIFQNRTPVTVNKTTTNITSSGQSEYFTPNSRFPEVSGRTPVMKNETFHTPIKSPFIDMAGQSSGATNNFNSELNNSHTSNITHTPNSDINISMRNNLKEKLPTLSDGSIKVYWYDAIEDQIQTKPAVIFFGKIFEPSTNTYSSISLIIKNITRTLYIYPKTADLHSVYKEFENLRSTKFSYIKDYGSKTVKKKYCFELPIPHGEHEVIKIKYLADMGTIPANLQGETFEYIFGRNSSLLDKIILNRKIKGPCWLKVKSYEQPTSLKHTFCRYEVIINDYKQMECDFDSTPNPPLKLMAVAFKTLNNNGTNEIFAITAAMKDNYYIENEKGNNQVTDFTPLVVLRKYDQSQFAPNQKDVNNNTINLRVEDYDFFKDKFGHQNFLLGPNETAVINQFVNRLHQFDPDIIIGHNLYTGGMELFFNRITRLKINNWAKIGKFRRDVLPKFLQNSNLGNFYVRSCMVGRLICDTFLSCRDILRENNYNLSYLSERHLKDTLPDIDTNIRLSVSSPSTILLDIYEILTNSLKEASLTMQLMDKLAILPLTKQLTNIAGNLWIKSLQNSRADRCEMFLMHEFNKNKYLLPDKVNKAEKFEDNMNEDREEEVVVGKKKPQYSGGLVLEPKIGLYDTIILLLDFNSLYPTIIQEFNICFTTVIRKPTQAFNYYDDKKKKNQIKKQNPDINAESTNNNENIKEEEEEDIDLDVKNAVIQGREKATLPAMLESLVLKRKGIKDLIKKEKDKFKLSMLDIKQKAIKLSANSLYGYLGYKNSRFYAKSIAALVTATGRAILQDTVNLVTNKHNLSIVYGDTDSIMINTGISDIIPALEMGNKVKNSVKEKYKLLEMEIDGVFKTLLLLRKKKYAYLKFEPPYCPTSKLTPEFKGLDLVRRDWCEISKQAGYHILDIILSNRTKEEIIHLIFDFLKDLGQKMDKDGFVINEYEITKQLTKNIEDYADAKALPHVKVAKRLKEKGDMTIKQNAYIPYVICIEVNKEPTSVNPVHHSKSLADRCYHPKEVLENPNLKLDINWYKENQIIASVARLCKHIDEIDMFQLATCLGIDGSKYTFNMNKNKDGNEVQNDIVMMDDNSSVVKCHAREGVTVQCTKCKHVQKINKISDKSTSVISILKCDECGQIQNFGYIFNNIIMNIKKNMFRYYKSTKKCCKCNESVTRFFMKKKCNDPNCSSGTYRKEQSECETANEVNFIKKLIESKGENKTMSQATIISIQNNLKGVEKYVKDVNQKIEYNTVDLANIFEFLKIN